MRRAVAGEPAGPASPSRHRRSAWTSTRARVAVATLTLAVSCGSNPSAFDPVTESANVETDATATSTATSSTATSSTAATEGSPTLEPTVQEVFVGGEGTNVVNPNPTVTPRPTRPYRGVTVERVGELDQAIAMASRPDSRATFVASQDGIIIGFDVDPTGGVRALGEVLDLRQRTVSDRERGLLSMAFDPTGSDLYVVFTNRETFANELVAFPVATDGTIDPAQERTVMTVPQPDANHNGGHIAFGRDGLLYYGLGDGGGQNDRNGNAQNLDNPLGSLLRIDPTPGAFGSYTIPDDNPFTDRGAPEIWASGLRNPWRFAFDQATGDLWIADVGQREREEVNFMAAGQGRGANYGWNIREGSQPFQNVAVDGTTTLTDPVYEYSHQGDRCSITGGVVYRGNRIPELQGEYLFGDFCTGEIDSLRLNGPTADLRDLDLSVRSTTLASFGEDPNGEVWILTLSGQILRLIAR